MKGKPSSPRPASELAETKEEIEAWLRDAVHAPVAARLPAPGDVIGGKYRIESLLGRGGMGAVFQARHLVSEKAVAIKWMLRPATDAQARRRFEREARAAGRVDHPNVVDVYDVGEDGDCSYLVMELLRGESLSDRLASGPIQPEEAADIAIAAMRGVAAAHRAGVIHRDLKPDNIFLCQGPDPLQREAKVLDFGISSITSKDSVNTKLTQEGMVLGSLAYMSPEQLSEPHDVDVRTDVYAFGVILYEMLTGALPFEGASYSALAVAIATAQPKRPSLIDPSIPRELEAIVLRALARARAERYPDVVSLAEALLPFSRNARASAAPRPGSASSPHSTGSLAPSGAPNTSHTPTRIVERTRRGHFSSKRILFAVGSLIALLVLWAFSARRSTVATPAEPPRAQSPVQTDAVAADRPQLGAEPAGVAPAASEPPPPPVIPVQEKQPKARLNAARNRKAPRAVSPPPQASEDVLFSGRK